MLTRLRFKNWRSLRDVTIDDLTPITVFIGANSSGKTNILDALYFMNRMVEEDSPEATYFRFGDGKMRTIGIKSNEPIQIECGFKIAGSSLSYSLSIQENGKNIHFDELISEPNFGVIQAHDGIGDTPFGRLGKKDALGLQITALASLNMVADIHPKSYFLELYRFIVGRWQFIDDNFILSTRFPNDEKTDVYTIDRKISNVPMMLEFIRQKYPETYRHLQEDISWLLTHVDLIETERDERETRFLIREKAHKKIEAPTISTGTTRMIAMLTAHYALDIRFPEMPGLVVIEEPDTALNPGLLERFVEQLRSYTGREGYPRQFILTTHNPTFLNYFKPEEVRVVERDEQGYTTVHKIPDHVSEIWLDKFGLGEVWTMRSFGGVPE